MKKSYIIKIQKKLDFLNYENILLNNHCKLLDIKELVNHHDFFDTWNKDKIFIMII
jgi:hypothetical protein